jgi:hypothetical protein
MVLVQNSLPVRLEPDPSKRRGILRVRDATGFLKGGHAPAVQLATLFAAQFHCEWCCTLLCFCLPWLYLFLPHWLHLSDPVLNVDQHPALTAGMSAVLANTVWL